WRIARQRETGRLRRAGDVHARLDPGVRNRAGGGHVENRIDRRGSDEAERAVAHQVEPASLELVGAAHGGDRADRGDLATRVLPDVQVAANRDVDVSECGSR